MINGFCLVLQCHVRVQMSCEHLRLSGQYGKRGLYLVGHLRSHLAEKGQPFMLFKLPCHKEALCDVLYKDQILRAGSRQLA